MWLSSEILAQGGVHLLSPDTLSTHPALSRMLVENTAMPAGENATEHFAFLLRPGTYEKTGIHVGYYCTVHGLGSTPDMTQASVFCLGALDQNGSKTGALDTFWRGAENLQMTPPTTLPEAVSGAMYYQVFDGGRSFGASAETKMPFPPDTAIWSVSQACWLRRISVNGHLWLDNVSPCSSHNNDGSIPALYASGGFVADVHVSGSINLMGQQQFCFLRSSAHEAVLGGAWNTVAVDCTFPSLGGALLQKNVVSTNLLSFEPYLKPYLIETAMDTYAVIRQETIITDFDFVYDVESLQASLDRGRTTIVLASPHALEINAEVHIRTPNTLILGLGIPELRLHAPFIVEAPGVELCGLLFSCHYADPQASLVQWSVSASVNSAQNVGAMVDCACRVGGPGVLDATAVACLALCEVQTNTKLRIENIHLWRADHGVAAYTGSCVGALSYNYCKHGLWVHPTAQVEAIGLASEHSLETPCLWEGDLGRVLFYQCELPYEIPEGSQPPVGLDVSGSHFYGLGLGVYCFFRAPRQGLWSPAGLRFHVPNAQVEGACTVWLNGCPNTGISSVVEETWSGNHRGGQACVATQGQAIAV